MSVEEYKLANELKKNKPAYIALAFCWIAKARHPLVGFINTATKEQMEQARQCLIIWKESALDQNQWDYEKAIQLIEMEIAGLSL